MSLMHRFRRKRASSLLRPEVRALRTLQAPDHVKDEDGTWRPSSAALTPSSGVDGYCSIDLEQLLLEDDLPPTVLYPSLLRSVGLIGIRIAALAAHGLKVDHVPVPDDWYHGGISGQSLRKSKLRRDLIKQHEIVVPIDENLAAEFHYGTRVGAVEA